MGIAIYFYKYSRWTNQKLYNDFAGKLIDEIYNETYTNCSLDFKNGLCGVAWGIEYLIRNGFVKADPDDALQDIDIRLIEWDVRKITDNSLNTGLKGIAAYVIARRQNRKNANH